ncbi:TonB-dependent receptor plug domain-containing protein [Arenimonas fontis]|uniref:TonB-dependent receptor n=1 Tax=Arenimonas fontis TaxID=2608255 RepID=A0A5B2Z8Z2_9GAMM|nr:TonB-dependent receptor [Arenimonas fontis]KAA2285188.1 TonB-dependent receptor [Arenimonas fontis]
MKKHALALALAQALAAPLTIAPALAQQLAAPASPDSARELDVIVVQGEISYRDRAEDIVPTLSYDLEYFQRFEPLTVGDMLKRVPSVAFVSDVLEYDGAQLRGLAPAYTQVLINGRKVPGAGVDRSFFVDRIPAELVERIEIVRAPSANRSGDAIAGALNIILRDSYEFDGAYVRAGALRFDDGELKPTYGAVASGEFAGGRLLGGVNVQGRYNPKAKFSTRFESPDGDFTDREDQTDVRDGTDYSANLSWNRDIGNGRLRLEGLYVLTDRTQTENSIEYNDPSSASRDNLLSVNDQVVDIDQRNLSLAMGYRWDMAGGRSEVELGYATFRDEIFDTEEEVGYDDDDTPPSFDEFEGVRTLTDVDDTELSLKLAHARDIGGADMEFGLDLMDKRRDTDLAVSEVDTDVEGEPLPPYQDFDLRSSRIDERRLDPYLMFTGAGQTLEWQAGLRYERTEVDVRADGEAAGNDYGTLLPSASLRWNLSEDDRINLSLGRSVRRPGFDQVLPLTLEEEYEDNDFRGNPALDPETAWGLDLGFERRLGRRGVVGVNLFYRKVDDLIELVNTGEASATALDDYADELEEFLDENPGAVEGDPGYPVFDPDSFVYTVMNTGGGKVWGVELDLSAPLTALNLPDTGVFLNYSWMDSETEDEFGKRRFNNQPRYVYNVGFIQDLPGAGVSFGASYRKQGEAQFRILTEEVSTRYGADLEVFVEKRFGERLSMRLTGSNLLDASKDEVFHKFDNAADQLARDYDEYELETESAGPVYQLILRYAF